MYVCMIELIMYEYMYICMYVCMYVYMYVCLSAYIICVYNLCIYVCM